MADVDRLLQFQTPQFRMLLCSVVFGCMNLTVGVVRWQNLSQTAGIQKNMTGLFLLYFQ